MSIKKKSALIVDDDESLLDLLSMVMGTLNIDVHVAPNGPEGLEVYKRIRPDIVIIDWVMDPYNGHELGLKIKSIDPDAIIIIITGMADNKKQKATNDSGFFRFISKPFNMREFNNCVSEALSASDQ